ncbi:MAG: M16 family metallopeptidase [Campylobacterota bacterium]
MGLFLRIAAILFILEGMLMSAQLEYIEIQGVKVPHIHEKDPTLPIGSMQLVFKGGGQLFEDKEGLSRFSAKMLGEGTKKSGASEFAAKLERYAIELNANRGNETFVVELTALKEHFDRGLKLAGELFSDPNITAESVAKVATMYKGELAAKENDYDYLAKRELNGLLYDAPLAGYTTPKDVDAISTEDVEKFLRQKLVLENVIVLTGGDMDKTEAAAKMREFLSVFQIGKKIDTPYFTPDNKDDDIIVKKPSQQAYIYFIAPLAQVEPKQQYLAKIASFILGSSGFGSRLMEEIRVKRGLAYSVHSRYVTNKTHSYFTGHLQTKLDSQQEAKKVVAKLVEDFVQNGASKEELEDAKKFLQGSYPLRKETLMQRISIAFSEHYKGLELGHSDKELEKIAQVTLEELNDFIKNHASIAHLRFSILTDTD